MMNHALIALASSGVIVAGAVADDPSTTMPDDVYETFRLALDLIDPPRTEVEALELLRDARWPDFADLEFVRIESAYDDAESLGWRIPDEGEDLLVVGPACRPISIPAGFFAEVVAVDHAAAIDDILDSVGRGERMHSIAQNWTSSRYGLGGWNAFFIDRAYEAAFFGRRDAAIQLLQAALRETPTYVSAVHENRSRLSYLADLRILESAAPWSEVTEALSRTAATYETGEWAERAQTLHDQLQRQIDEHPPVDMTVDAPAGPLEARIAHFITRLPEVRGTQSSNKSRASIYRTELYTALVDIGRPAVPALIDALDDTRMTRTVSRYGFGALVIHYRVQDAAVECIEAILDVRFYPGGGTSSHFSTESAEERAAVVADIEAWWVAYGDRDALAGYVARLDVGRLHERLRMLRRIEAIDPDAVDSIAALKRWVPEVPYWEVPDIAAALVARGDTSLVEVVRERVRSTRHNSCSQSIHFIARHGDADDFAWFLDRIAMEMEEGESSLREQVRWRDIAIAADSARRPIAAPILITLLRHRDEIAERATTPSNTYHLVDVIFRSAMRYASHEVEYDDRATIEDKDEIVTAWLEWWSAEGEAAFVAAHPHVEQLIDR